MASLNTETLNKPAPSLPPAGVTMDDPHDQLRAEPKVKIKVHKTGRPEESADVYVGVNGIGFQIQRGVEVEVPLPVLKVLEDAIQTAYVETPTADGKSEYKPHPVQAYPFTRIQ